MTDYEAIWRRYQANGETFVFNSNTGCVIRPFDCKNCPKEFYDVCGSYAKMLNILLVNLRKKRLEKLLS